MEKKRPRLVVLRHGIRPTNPSFDTHLLPDGLLQAEQIVDKLKTTPLQGIYCSPYIRCLEMAQPISHATGLPIWVDFRLAESFSKEDIDRLGDTLQGPRLLTLYERDIYGVNRIYTDGKDPPGGVPQVETWEDLLARTGNFIHSIQDLEGTYLCVTHMSPINAIYANYGHERESESPFGMGELGFL